MTTLRWARDDDVEAIARIHWRCFPGPDPAERARRFRADARCDVGDLLVAERNGRIVGGATVIPQRVWTGGCEHTQGGVASVQVDPDFRRHGIAQALMKRLLEGHRERNLGLSMLYPYSPPFYRRMGYATIEHWIELRLRTASLDDCDDASQVRTATDDDFDRIVDCHRRSLAGHNGAFARPAGVWKQRVFTKSRLTAVFESDGRIEGYFIFELTPTPDGLQQTLQIREWVTPEGRAARALAGYLSRQKAQCPEVRLFAPADFPLALVLGEPRSPLYDNPFAGRYTSGTTGAGAMARVVDLAAVFRSGRSFVGPPFACCFRVVELAESSLSGGQTAAEEVSIEFDGAGAQPTRQKPSAWFECDPGTMAQIYFGALKPRDATWWGVAKADSNDTLTKLDALFAQRAPFVHPLDYF